MSNSPPAPPQQQPDKSYDALAARLQALKGKSSKDAAEKPVLETSVASGDDDIAARFLRLTAARGADIALSDARNFLGIKGSDHSVEPGVLNTLPDQDGGGGGETPHHAEDDQTLEELLAELGEARTFGVEEEEEMKGLLSEAEGLKKEGEVAFGGDGERRDEDEGGNRKEGEGEQEEADEYISKVLAELEMEKRQGVDSGVEEVDDDEEDKDVVVESESVDRLPFDSTRNDPESTEDNDDVGEGGDLADLVLPSAPSSLPSDPQQESQHDPADDILAARLAALTLPSRSDPSVTKVQPKTLRDFLDQQKVSSLKTYTDEEMESWCVICNEDATVRCSGCDGDLYCRDCWEEGHRGPGAGFDERKHRALVFNRGERGKEKRKVAA